MTPFNSINISKDTSFSDYAHEIDQLVSAERERIDRILHRIDESMAAIQNTRKIIGGCKR